MSINLRLLVPEETTNYILNPEMRFDTTGWTLSGSTISRSLDYARFGIASLKVVTAGLAVNEGAYYTTSFRMVESSALYTASVYVRGSGRVRLRMKDLASAEYMSDSVFFNGKSLAKN